MHLQTPDYKVVRAAAMPAAIPDWHESAWAIAEVGEIIHFRPESSSHRPVTQFRLLYDNSGLHGIFRVQDRYVRCARTSYCAEVWKDSCVEFFAQPAVEGPYINFEFNCGGAFLCSCIADPERVPGGFRKFSKIPETIGRQITVRSTLPPITVPELQQPTVWLLRFHIPFGVFRSCLDISTPVSGSRWRGNFFKCAEENSHPHWASWSPVDEFNFHRPGCFGTLTFE